MFTVLPDYEYFDPEFSNNLEIGYKIQSKNNRFFISASLFYLKWIDLQLDINPAIGVWVKDNIGNVVSKGCEIELNAKPFLGNEIDFSLGLNESNYLGFEYLGKDIKGNQTIMAPKSTAFLSIQQLIPFSKNIGMLLKADSRYMGKQYFDLINTIEQKNYFLFNLNCGMMIHKTNINFWVQNLTQQKYISYAMPGYFKYSLLNRPRTWGITLETKF